MNIIIKEIILILLAYYIGSFSFARIITKIFRNLNICKVGDLTADATNVYRNVSKTLGIVVWILDFLRIYISLWFVWLVFLKNEPELLILVGFSMIVGHCFPIMHRFVGSRGVVAYIALLFFFAPYATLIVGIACLVILIFFRQIRFIQYMMVIMVPVVYYILRKIETPMLFSHEVNVKYLLLASIIMGILNFFVSKRYGEI
ncbi:MAG: glycerol-3-phosphate acyltransferase [Candidatus Cloacimonetes bacterium]|nr:glycerol-3-phosphate acyltransferase [Candidatus Cloacimonadota bacterium]MBL7086433.1 glycerol-3-phosphate acyltransferase [Candidatus Cloacimonadota bacterium]